MKLARGTAADTNRIYSHNESFRSPEAAEKIDRQLYLDASSAERSATKFHGALTYKSINNYNFFYGRDGDVEVIYAIYHQKEDWWNLAADRFDEFDED